MGHNLARLFSLRESVQGQSQQETPSLKEETDLATKTYKKAVIHWEVLTPNSILQVQPIILRCHLSTRNPRSRITCLQLTIQIRSKYSISSRDTSLGILGKNLYASHQWWTEKLGNRFSHRTETDKHSIISSSRIKVSTFMIQFLLVSKYQHREEMTLLALESRSTGLLRMTARAVSQGLT